MLGSLMIGWMTPKLSKKLIATMGLLIIGVFGIMPFFWEGYYLMFLSRFLIGFGFGIVSPMNLAIIAEFFKPEERAAYMGLHVVGMGIGTMVSNLLGGILASTGCRYYFFLRQFGPVSRQVADVSWPIKF
jgi:MFS family permease